MIANSIRLNFERLSSQLFPCMNPAVMRLFEKCLIYVICLLLRVKSNFKCSYEISEDCCIVGGMDALQLQYELIVAFILLVVGFLLGLLISRLSTQLLITRLSLQFTYGKIKALALLVPPAGSFLIYLILANNVIWRLINSIGGLIDKLGLSAVYQELAPMNILAILIGATLGGIFIWSKSYYF